MISILNVAKKGTSNKTVGGGDVDSLKNFIQKQLMIDLSPLGDNVNDIFIDGIFGQSKDEDASFQLEQHLELSAIAGLLGKDELFMKEENVYKLPKLDIDESRHRIEVYMPQSATIVHDLEDRYIISPKVRFFTAGSSHPIQNGWQKTGFVKLSITVMKPKATA